MQVTSLSSCCSILGSYRPLYRRQRWTRTLTLNVGEALDDPFVLDFAASGVATVKMTPVRTVGPELEL